ncbi:MAG TPA: DUF378 domain-containing protein [Phycisphaerales bacterium]|nr:DUF378 domain-containing protein [Phycisphaerales bacterium]
MKGLFVAALILVLVGALNWGLVGAFNFDLVAALFGDGSGASRTVYTLVGIAAVVLAITTAPILRGRGTLP